MYVCMYVCMCRLYCGDPGASDLRLPPDRGHAALLVLRHDHEVRGKGSHGGTMHCTSMYVHVCMYVCVYVNFFMYVCVYVCQR